MIVIKLAKGYNATICLIVNHFNNIGRTLEAKSKKMVEYKKKDLEGTVAMG